MVRKHQIWTRVRQTFGLVAVMLYSGYLLVDTLSGDSSIRQLKALKEREASLLAVAATVHAERAALEESVNAMRTDALDADRLEEEVRKMLGYAHQDEVILILE